MESDAAQRRQGRCACASVRYEVTGPMRSVANCHCEHCRRATGHHVAASGVTAEQLDVTDDGSLRWYRASDSTEYAFCSTCGSTLFWRASDKPDHISVMAGTLDQPTGLTTTSALFVSQAGDYHRLDNKLDNYDLDWQPGRTT